MPPKQTQANAQVVPTAGEQAVNTIVPQVDQSGNQPTKKQKVEVDSTHKICLISNYQDCVRLSHWAHNILMARERPERIQVLRVMTSFLSCIGANNGALKIWQTLDVPHKIVPSLLDINPELKNFPSRSADGLKLYFRGDSDAAEGMAIMMAIFIQIIKIAILGSPYKQASFEKRYLALARTAGSKEPRMVPTWMDGDYIAHIAHLFDEGSEAMSEACTVLRDYAICPLRQSVGETLLDVLRGFTSAMGTRGLTALRIFYNLFRTSSLLSYTIFKSEMQAAKRVLQRAINQSNSELDYCGVINRSRGLTSGWTDHLLYEHECRKFH